MVKKVMDKKQSKLEIITLDSNIPKNHISHFVVNFIDEVYDDLGIYEDDKKTIRTAFPIKTMLKLLFTQLLIILRILIKLLIW